MALTLSTKSANNETVKKEWFHIDATNLVLGRLASEIAHRLRGKHKAEFTRHVDTGDYIVVTNVEKLIVTGNKAKGKIYYRHTGYPGGIKEASFEKLIATKPEMVLQKAVKGMLPKGPLGYQMFSNLKIYSGNDHPHAAQQPVKLDMSHIRREVNG